MDTRVKPAYDASFFFFFSPPPPPFFFIWQTLVAVGGNDRGRGEGHGEPHHRTFGISGAAQG